MQTFQFMNMLKAFLSNVLQFPQKWNIKRKKETKAKQQRQQQECTSSAVPVKFTLQLLFASSAISSTFCFHFHFQYNSQFSTIHLFHPFDEHMYDEDVQWVMGYSEVKADLFLSSYSTWSKYMFRYQTLAGNSASQTCFHLRFLPKLNSHKQFNRNAFAISQYGCI